MREVNKEAFLMNSLQQWKQLELYSQYPSQTAYRATSSEEFIASRLSESPTGQIRLMESICERNNMRRAIRRVIKNKGAPGVDGLTVRKLKRYFKRHRAKIERALLDGTYVPMPDGRRRFPSRAEASACSEFPLHLTGQSSRLRPKS